MRSPHSSRRWLNPDLIGACAAPTVADSVPGGMQPPHNAWASPFRRRKQTTRTMPDHRDYWPRFPAIVTSERRRACQAAVGYRHRSRRSRALALACALTITPNSKLPYVAEAAVAQEACGRSRQNLKTDRDRLDRRGIAHGARVRRDARRSVRSRTWLNLIRGFAVRQRHDDGARKGCHPTISHDNVMRTARKFPISGY